MFYLSELYSPKSSWLSLSQEKRKEFFARIQTGMTALAGAGIEVIAMGHIDNKKIHSATQHFFAIWKVADEPSLNALLEGIRATGWHDYFDTVNAAGIGGDIASHLAALAALQP